MKKIYLLMIIFVASIFIGAGERSCLVEIVSPEEGLTYSIDEIVPFEAKISDSTVSRCRLVTYYDIEEAVLEEWIEDQWEPVLDILNLEPDDPWYPVSWSSEIIPEDFALPPGEYRFYTKIKFNYYSSWPNPRCSGSHENWSLFTLAEKEE